MRVSKILSTTQAVLVLETGVPVALCTTLKKLTMPIPNPNETEKRSEYLNRCMADDTMVDEYPNQSQRFAICAVKWKESIK
jgi:hypothetical protein